MIGSGSMVSEGFNPFAQGVVPIRKSALLKVNVPTMFVCRAVNRSPTVIIPESSAKLDDYL
jgi:hypothetical protein